MSVNAASLRPAVEKADCSRHRKSEQISLCSSDPRRVAGVELIGHTTAGDVGQTVISSVSAMVRSATESLRMNLRMTTVASVKS